MVKHILIKGTAIAGVAVGYVLGTRAGRERYEDIKRKSKEVWADPRVQDTVHQAEQRVKDTARQAEKRVKEKVADGTNGTSGGARADFDAEVRSAAEQVHREGGSTSSANL